jgi:NTP pyrophosphatase (non-canonical NTP hydrolase)
MTYEEWVLTKAKPYPGQPAMARLHAALGLNEEAGECAGLVKKQDLNLQKTDPNRLLEEAGDALFYLTWLLHTFDFSLEDAMEANREKLDKRYPGGYIPGGGIR